MANDDKEELDQSTDVEPIRGSIDIAIPPDVLWAAFDQPWLWPRWNPRFFWCAPPAQAWRPARLVL
ncbi:MULTISPECIES: SRPBCC family protein [Rhizobium]|nr:MULTISPECIES: SRPBCC family protein [Rhizobium]KZS54768.1 hypothetical protein AS890_03775 [Rhizobium anhuiense bv. trifolii]MBA9036842.1 hypothetical protein [Rhizobium leguminosarum]